MLFFEASAAVAAARTGLAIATGDRVPLAGTLEVLRTSRAAGIDDVRADPGFAVLPGNLADGFGGKAVWLRTTLRAGTPADAGLWWLALPTTYLESIQAFLVADGHVEALGDAGTARPFLARPLPYRHPVFAVVLPADEPRTLYLRIASDTSRVAAPTLWRPAAFAAAEQDENVLDGVLFGAVLVVSLCSVFLWLWLRQSVYLVYALYTFGAGALQAVTLGYAQQWLFPALAGVMTPLLGVSMALGVGLGVEMLRVLRLPQHMPRLMRRLRRVAWAVTAVLAVAALAGQFRFMSPAAQLLFVVEALGSSVLAVTLWRRGEVIAKYFLLAFCAHYVALALLLLRSIGVVTPGFWVDHSVQVSILAHVLLMNLVLARLGFSLQEAADTARAQLLEASQRATRELDAKVGERTAALVHEIDRRQRAEAEVRQSRDALAAALGAEQRARDLQRELFLMVSHEMRTPVSVLSFSLTGQPDAEALSRARRALDNLENHVDAMLTGDRLDQIDALLDISPTRLLPLMLAAVVRVSVYAPAYRVTLTEPAEPPMGLTDSIWLQLVLDTLVSNAVRHTPAGTHVVVDAVTTGEHWCIRVTDDGPGLSADALAAVALADEDDKTARGLSLARRIMVRLGGRLSLENLPRGGCRATVMVTRHAMAEQD